MSRLVKFLFVVVAALCLVFLGFDIFLLNELNESKGREDGFKLRIADLERMVEENDETIQGLREAMGLLSKKEVKPEEGREEVTIPPVERVITGISEVIKVEPLKKERKVKSTVSREMRREADELFRQAVKCYLQDDVPSTIKHLRKALRLNPENEEARELLAILSE